MQTQHSLQNQYKIQDTLAYFTTNMNCHSHIRNSTSYAYYQMYINKSDSLELVF